jgi:hypothetical protein
MSVSWQDVVAASVVLAAVGYLGYRGWLMAIQRGSGACGCGDTCPQKTDTSQSVVQIKPLADDQT